MRIISCASYYGTGSSAITDYIAEFDNCFSLTNYEFRFVQDPGGISDLEYNLVENHHRHNSGHALKKYKKIVDFLAGNVFIEKYEPFFNNQWKKISYEYIDSLTDFIHNGYWHQDVIDKGYGFYIRKRLINKILQKTIWRRQIDRGLNEMPNEITLYSRPSEEKFLSLTREYIDKLFICANKENKEDVMVDQIVPPSNLNRYIRYFNDINVFVVDRDPRDLYLLEKYIWKGKIIPTENVDIFCKWFRYTRAHRKSEVYDKEYVMFVQFEDLIYKYDDMTERIKQWLGYTETNHLLKKKYLNPKKSMRNTQLWKQISGVEKEIAYIENELTEYMYDYSQLGIINKDR